LEVDNDTDRRGTSMPQRYWRHTCQGIETLRTTARCPACGERAEFDGWRYGLEEAMAVYQYVTGLKPIGPHRDMADGCLAGMREPCEHCDGRGLLTVSGTVYAQCPACEATGGVWTRPFEEVEAVLGQVLAFYPDAAVAQSPGSFLRHAVRFDARNRVVVPRRARARGSANGDAERQSAAPPAVAEPSAVERPAAEPDTAGSRRKPGYSQDGIRFTDVTDAFRAAEQALGSDWKLQGHGHCPRVTLRPWYSRFAKPGTVCWDRFYPSGCGSMRTLFPRELVVKAAQILGVDPSVLIGQAY
jgi:hypothetical protein